MAIPGTRRDVAEAHVALMRRVAVVLFLSGAAYLVGYTKLAMLPEAQSLGLWCAATLALSGVVMWLLPARNSYGTVGAFLAIAIISALLSEPDRTGTIALFYLWPIVALAYFMRWQVLAAGVAWIAVTLAPALLIAGDATAHVLYVGTLSTVAVMGLLVAAMHQHESRLHRRLELASQLDPLTGLLNRRAFALAVDDRLSWAAARGTDLSVVLLDVDHFKRFNDGHGHLAGDEALRRIGSILLREARTEDLVCRFGGEEFAVVLTGAAPWGALRFIERVASALHDEPVADELRLTASWGVASATPLAPATLSQLLGRADDALYAAKTGGRNRAALWGASGCKLQPEFTPVDHGEREAGLIRRVARRSDGLADQATETHDDLPAASATMAALKDDVQPRWRLEQLGRNDLIKATSIAMFFGGALNAAVACLLLGDLRPEAAQRSQWLLALIMSVIAASMLRRPGSLRMAKFTALGGSTVIALVLATATPLGAVVLFYVWPVAMAAYFGSRRFAALTVGWIALTAAPAVAASPDVDMVRSLTFTGTVINVALLTSVVSMMRWHEGRLQQRLADLSELDSLTGLLNRRALQDRFDSGAVAAAGRQLPIAVLVLDADHFKQFNDTHGHLAGDEALRTIADQLRAAAGPSDLVCRYGGEEFVVVLRDAGISEAQRYAGRVAAALAATTGTAAGGPAVTLSGGISIGDAGESLLALLERADAALYAAKDAGRARTAAPQPAGGYAMAA